MGQTDKSSFEVFKDEIIKLNPRLILITGNLNPTFSSDGISYCLVDFNNELYEFCGGFGQYVIDENVKINISKIIWLQTIIEELEKLCDNRFLWYKKKGIYHYGDIAQIKLIL